MNSDNTNTYKLSDGVVAQIAKVLQVAILTGTDITDNLRMLSLVCPEGENILSVDPEYEKTFNEGLDRMLNHVETAEEEANDAE